MCLFSVLITLRLIELTGSLVSAGETDVLTNINSILCSTSVIDGFDPNRVFRVGRKYTLDDCVGTSPIESIDDLSKCAIAPRRRAPGCDSYYISRAGEEWTPAVSLEDPFLLPFFPGGPGIGQSPFAPFVAACSVAYPLGASSTENVDFTTEFLCEKPGLDSSNPWEPFDLVTCETDLLKIEQAGASGTATYCQRMDDGLSEQPEELLCTAELDSELFVCDGELPDTHSNRECVIFAKFFSAAGRDCEIGLAAGQEASFNTLGDYKFGFEWFNADPSIGPFAGFTPSLQASLVCGKKSDFVKQKIQHTVCKVSDFDALETVLTYLDDTDFVGKGYTFGAQDCSNGLPSTRSKRGSGKGKGKDGKGQNKGRDEGRCIATVRSTFYCCEYSFNFKAIGPDETIAGVEGPGVSFQVWLDGKGDESSCDARSMKKDVQIEYLCFQK